jgi:catechol 2,3-dioxygenase-like lactoylglutathione lyase family enzyme
VIPRFSHVNIEVEDAAAARTFYAGVLGLREVARAEGARRPGAWFDLGGAELHVSEQPGCAAANRASMRHFCIVVGDLTALRRALASAAAPLEDGRPLPGLARCFTRDPSGNRIELVSRGQDPGS